MSLKKIAFGTEGWRAVIAEEFTADNVRRVAQGIAGHLLAKGGRAQTVAVGYDTRFLSDYFARAVCEVLTANGIRCILSNSMVPTCAVSRYVVAKRLPAGVMVTASHNPGIYNGIKIKESYGGSATTETVASVEAQIDRHPAKRLDLEQASLRRLLTTVDMMPEFLGGIRKFVNLAAIRRSPFRVVVESMHGAGGNIIEQLLKGGRCRVTTLHPERNPLFGGRAPEPIPANLQELMATVKRTRADLGIANDGDADRLGIIGPGGAWLNPGQVMCVLLLHLVKERGMRGAVVKTVSNTMMINRLTEALGIRLIEVPVGFKHVAKLMLTQDILIGGEESGGIGMKGYMPERDGILNGLMVLEAMAVKRRSLGAMMRDLERAYGRWHYGRRDLHLTMKDVEALFKTLERSAPGSLAGVPVTAVNRLDGVKLIGRDDSWLLFRRSGTEPIVRIYAETPTQSHLSRLLDLGVRLAQGR